MTVQLERSQLVTFGTPFLIIFTSILLALSPLPGQLPNLAMGITYDLTITAPLVYFFLIKKKKIPKITVVPFFIGGVLLATFLLPEQQKAHLHLITKYLLPAVEVAVVVFILSQVYKATKLFKERSRKSHDFYLILQESAVKILGYPRIAQIIATEIGMVYYAFLAWKKVPKPKNTFTGYQENGITALLVIILFILLVETFVVHLLVVNWSATGAWVLTLGSLYAVVQIVGHLKALRRRFTEITNNRLHLKYGLFGDMHINLNHIKQVSLVSDEMAATAVSAEKLALLPAIESHNVVIYFTQKQKIEKAYGITRECDAVLLHLDQKDEFVLRLNQAISPQ